MGISVAVVRVVAICLGLIVVGHASFAIGQGQPQSPTDLVRELTDKLRTCPRNERENLLIEILDCFLGPDGKPMIPTLLGMLEDKTPPPKQYSFGFYQPSRELTEQEIRDQEADTILEVIASFGREGVDPMVVPTRDPSNMQHVVELGAAIVPTLIEAVEEKLPADEWYDYNYMASEALGLIGKDAASAVPALCKLLKESKDPGIRQDAAVALGRIGANSELTVPALTSTFDDGWAKVRGAAAEALLSFGNDAKPALKKLRELEDSEYASVRQPVKAAIAALSDQ